MGLSERLVRNLVQQNEKQSTAELLEHWKYQSQYLPEVVEASRRILEARGVPIPDPAKLVRCPACRQGTFDKEQMDYPCPMCAYVPSSGMQEPNALLRLVRSSIRGWVKEQEARTGRKVRKSADAINDLQLGMDGPIDRLGRAIGQGVSSADLLGAPWFCTLVPRRERLAIQGRIYGIALCACVGVFLAAFAAGARQTGFGLTLALGAAFFWTKDIMAKRELLEAFDREYAKLRSEFPEAPADSVLAQEEVNRAVERHSRRQQRKGGKVRESEDTAEEP